LIIGGEDMIDNEQQQVKELSKGIIDYMRGRTGNNFQNDVNIVLEKYYK